MALLYILIPPPSLAHLCIFLSSSLLLSVSILLKLMMMPCVVGLYKIVSIKASHTTTRQGQWLTFNADYRMLFTTNWTSNETLADVWCVACVWQITVAEPVGPDIDEFILRVRNATTGWPWYKDEPTTVCLGLQHVIMIVKKSVMFLCNTSALLWFWQTTRRK